MSDQTGWFFSHFSDKILTIWILEKLQSIVYSQFGAGFIITYNYNELKLFMQQDLWKTDYE